MSDDNILLSLCIPTCNRAVQLNRCLDNIVCQPEFSVRRLVEIVISDNCSTDETESVIQSYVNRFPGQIVTYRQDTFKDFAEQFATVARLARGTFIKFHNDTILERPGALKLMVETVKQGMSRRDLLWFANGSLVGTQCQGVGLDWFLENVSFFNTWIMPFGCWRSDVERLCDICKADSSKIPQTIFLLEEMANGRGMQVANDCWCEIQEVSKKGGYNVAEVFGYNYLSLLKSYLKSGSLSKKIYDTERRKLLIKHINPFYFDVQGKYAFEKTGYWKWLSPFYAYDSYFYRDCVKYAAKMLSLKFCRMIMR